MFLRRFPNGRAVGFLSLSLQSDSYGVEPEQPVFVRLLLRAPPAQTHAAQTAGEPFGVPRPGFTPKESGFWGAAQMPRCKCPEGSTVR